MSEPCSLYRFRNSAGDLLYVGISSRLPARLSEHEKAQTGWAQVANIAVEHFPCRAEAQAAEQAAMDTEGPRWNRNRSIGGMSMRAFRVPLDLYVNAQQAAKIDQRTISSVIREALEKYVKKS